MGVAVFYGTEFDGIPLRRGLGARRDARDRGAGAIYGALSARLASRDTLLPLLFLPLLAPVLIAATRAFEIGLGREAGGGWSWVALLGIFAVVYLGLGALLFRPLLEDA